MKVTLFLVFLCIVGFYLEFTSGNPEQVVDMYGFSGQNMLQRPEVFLTSIFLHGSLDHLLSNIFVLLFFGMAVESEIGSWRTLMIFILGAVIGDLMSLLVYPMDTVAIGASAGVFALVGLGTIVKPFDISFYPYFLPIPLGFLGIMYAVYNAIGFIYGPSNVSYIAHFGGLFVGLSFGFRRQGWKRGLKTLLILFSLLALIPIIWIVLKMLLLT
jgi:hypothetical protein